MLASCLLALSASLAFSAPSPGWAAEEEEEAHLPAFLPVCSTAVDSRPWGIAGFSFMEGYSGTDTHAASLLVRGKFGVSVNKPHGDWPREV